MFPFHWDPTMIVLILIAGLLIVFSAFALFKKAKRAVRRWHYASLASGKALLIGTLLFGGGDEVQALLEYTPYSFQQTMLSSDFDFDYKDDRILFSKDEVISGYVQIDDRNVKVFMSAEISAPKNLQTVYKVVDSFTPTSREAAQIRDLVNKKLNRQIRFAHGYVELKGNKVEVMLERPMTTNL